MPSYYWLSPTIDCDTFIASCPGNGFPYGKDLFSILNHSDQLPFNLEIRELMIGRYVVLGDLQDLSRPRDFILNTLSFPIISERMKEIIEQNLFGTEFVSWRSVTIRGKNSNYYYYFPFFRKKLDIMDVNKSIIAPNSGAVISATYDKEKLQRFAISHNASSLWQVPSKLIINEMIKTQFEKAGLSGFETILIP